MEDLNYTKFFEHHVVVTKFVSQENKCGYFLVRNPEDYHLWFQITFSPGVFMLSGDIGEMVFNKPISWLSEKVINSTDYLLEKLSQDMKNLYKFSPQLANEYINQEELVSENKDAIATCKRVLRDFQDNPSEVNMHNFYLASQPLWEGDDPPYVEELRTHIKCQIEALRKFCQLVPNVFES